MNRSAKFTFWARSFFFTLMQRFSLFFFGLGSFFLLTHYFLNKEEVGIFALFQTIIGLTEYLKMGLLRNALIKLKYDRHFAERTSEVYTASLIINCAFSVLAILVLLAFARDLSNLLHAPQLRELLHASVFLVILQIPFSHCEIVQQSVMNYKPTFWAYCIRQGTFFAFIAIALLVKEIRINNYNLVLAQMLALLFGGMYYVWTARTALSAKTRVDFTLIKKLLGFGRYVFGTALLSYLYKFADHFVTASMVDNPTRGKIYVSYYNVVSRVSNVLDVPFMAVADVLFPKSAMAHAAEGPAKVKYYFERMVGVLTALIIPVSLVILFLPALVIRIIAGSAYLPAVPILQITMAFAFLRPFYTQFGFTMDSIGKPQVNFWINALCLSLSLASTFISIYYFGGLMGAAYANILTLVTGCIIFYFVLSKYLDVKIASIFRYILLTYSDVFSLLKKNLTHGTETGNIKGA